MANPVATLQRNAAEFNKMSSKDKRRVVADGILNNALYIRINSCLNTVSIHCRNNRSFQIRIRI